MYRRPRTGTRQGQGIWVRGGAELRLDAEEGNLVGETATSTRRYSSVTRRPREQQQTAATRAAGGAAAPGGAGVSLGQKETRPDRCLGLGGPGRPG